MAENNMILDKEKELNFEQLGNVSGGERVHLYGNTYLRCDCGCEDFACCGWDPERHGYNVKCNNCGKMHFVYR